MNVPLELYTAFNDVKFYDEPHKYYIDNTELISVTTLIHKYQNDFDVDYWSEYKASQFNVTQDEIKRAWNFINKKGTLKGSLIHSYAENLFQNKIYEYPTDLVLNTFGFDPIKKEYDITKKYIDNFYRDTFDKLISIKTEIVLCDKDYKIGGMIDVLFYNKKMNEFQIWDYKTNKDFTYENKRNNLLFELSDLEDCDLEIYSLQLSLYKYLIEKNTSIKLGGSYLIWVSHNNDNYKIIKTKDRTEYIEKILKK